jgi:sugar O-acyltransferase (sialic acid O-acetyltransferase NeuD family)
MRIAVYGSGGHGKVVADILTAASEHEVVAFLDDDPKRAGVTVDGIPVQALPSNLRERSRPEKIEAIALGIGDNTARASAVERCRAAGLVIVQAIHPRATIARSAQLGPGVVVMAGAVVNPFAHVDEGACINTSATVDHDCRIHRYVHVFPGANIAGTVEIGEFSYIGMGASVLQNLRIGKRVVVGAGAVVLEDLEDGVTAVGVPARRIKSTRPSGGNRT